MALPKEGPLSLADLLGWDEDVRAELIEGVPFMHAAPSRIHQSISRNLLVQIFGLLDGKPCEVYHAPFAVRLFEAEGDRPEDVDTVVEPDLVVVCDPDKLDDIGCKGAPDLIIEILSPSTQRNDRMVKFGLYQRAGVPEYWIVDPESRTVQVCTLEDGQYFAPRVFSREDRMTAFHGMEIDLASVFAGI